MIPGLSRLFVVAIVVLMASAAIPLHIEMIGAEEINNQNAVCLSYIFSSPSYTTVEIYGGEFTRVGLEDLPLSGKEGEPRLPVKPLRILLPASTIVKEISVEVSEAKALEITDLNSMELGGKTHCLSKQPSELQNQSRISLYNKAQLYPSQIYKNLGVQYFRGYAILHVNLYPVQYLGETNTLYYYDRMSVVVEVTETSGNSLYRGDARNDIKKMVENPEALMSYKLDTTINSQSSDTYEYIIITTEELKNASGEYTFDDLLNYRISQGLSCTYKTVEDIENEYEGTDTQEKIRNFIRDAYLNWNTTWILLGGDVGKVPIRFLYDIDGGEQDEDEMTSDLYYQCLDGNYNYDGDAVWGEKNDGVDGEIIDLYAEVYVGRAPVDDEVDISAFVEKTLAYENSEWGVDEYLEKHLSAGEIVWSGNGGYGSGYVERCIDFCSDYGHETNGIPTRKYSIIELYERDASWSFTDAMDAIDEGVSIINHVGHGSVNAAMKISIYDVLSLENTGEYGLFYTQACHSGQLEKSDECIAERWVNAEKVGGFAAIMNTGYGYGSLYDYDGADNRYAREFFDALFSPHEEISRIGKANQDSKEDNYYRLDEANMYHVYYDTLLFGDPYVEIKGAEDTKADFTWDPSYPLIGETISFTDKSTGDLIYREWNFGDGKYSTKKNPTHAYTGESVYIVTLTIYDVEGYMSTITHNVEVRAQWPPFAIAEPEYYYGGNLTVEFCGDNSWDPDGYIVSYQWNFDDGTTSDIPNPTHEFPLNDAYNVRFSVVDNDGNMDTLFCNIIIQEQSPPDTPDAPSGQTDALTGNTYVYTVVTLDPEGDDIQYGWNFDDGGSIQWSEWYSSDESCSMSHTWNSLGTHLVRVKARDIWGGESNWSDPLMVTTEDDDNPIVQILKPEAAIYFGNKKILPFFTPVGIGSLDIEILANDSSGIDRVEFYVDGEPVAEVRSEPYTWTWKGGSLFRHQHTVKIIAYDNSGHYTSKELVVWKFL